MEETYNYESPNNYYHNTPSQSRGHRPYNGQSRNRQFRGFVPQNRGQRPQYSQHQFQNYCYQRSALQQNRTQYGSSHKPYFQNNAGTYQYYTHDQQSEQYGPPCSLCGGFTIPPSIVIKGNMILITLWKR